VSVQGAGHVKIRTLAEEREREERDRKNRIDWKRKYRAKQKASQPRNAKAQN